MFLLYCRLTYLHSMLCFTKLMRPLVRLWRGAGIRCVVYIDNGLIVSEGQERGVHDSSMITVV